MQVNMLEAKSQLSKLVKAAIAGEEVVIASHGKAHPEACDAAFSDSVEVELCALMNG